MNDSLSFRSLTAFLLTLALTAAAFGNELPAFPGAEGAGAFATGGRGGRVIEVTTLDDAGPGSLRAALREPGARTIVFRVSGNIELKSKLAVPHGDVTIAGQTAPGGGICLKNFGVDLSGARNVIVRYLRVRPGDSAGAEMDALGGRDCENILVDHCSASWSSDETVSFYNCRKLTVQWCIISESLYQSVHHKGAHGYGGIWGGTDSSWHHNLIAHHTSRTPRFERDEINVDFRNNVIFNWGFNGAYGGERSAINMIANYFQPGPATAAACRERILDASADGGRWYIEGNVVAGADDLTNNNWLGGIQRPWTRDLEKLRSATSFPAAFVTMQTAEQAWELVLAQVGATLPARDPVDQRVVAEARDGKATLGRSFNGGGNGIIDTPADAGGWPELKPGTPAVDRDRDGMTDSWEQQHQFAADDPQDGAADADGDGYTNLEEFLNLTDPRKRDHYALPKESPVRTAQPDKPVRFWRHEITVAADGSGDVESLQAAIDAAPAGQTKPFVIRLQPGVYRGHLVVPPEKPFLTFRGTDAGNTTITDDKNFNSPATDGRKLNAQQSATVYVQASDFSAEKIAFENTTGPGIQALAMFAAGDRARFKDCRFLGWQDTLRLENGRAWLRNCRIEGSVDFIYGSGTAFFDRCELHCVADGCISAPSTPAERAYGFVFDRCRVTAKPNVKQMLLGRPWRDHGSATFLSCELPASVSPAGWHNWDQPAREATARFSEFQSTGPGAAPEKRTSWSRQLSKDEARKITVAAVLAGEDAWTPDKAKGE